MGTNLNQTWEGLCFLPFLDGPVKTSYQDSICESSSLSDPITSLFGLIRPNAKPTAAALSSPGQLRISCIGLGLSFLWSSRAMIDYHEHVRSVSREVRVPESVALCYHKVIYNCFFCKGLAWHCLAGCWPWNSIRAESFPRGGGVCQWFALWSLKQVQLSQDPSLVDDRNCVAWEKSRVLIAWRHVSWEFAVECHHDGLFGCRNTCEVLAVVILLVDEAQKKQSEASCLRFDCL